MIFGVLRFAALFIILAIAARAEAEPWLVVNTDETKLIRLATPATEVIISNPSIADVAILAPNLLAVTGKGYGAVNLIVRGTNGVVITDAMVQVAAPAHPVVVLYLGSSRQSFSCSPLCQPMFDPSDSPERFDAIAKQVQVKLGQKVSEEPGEEIAPPGEYPCDSARQRDSAGNRCGGRSAYNRSGGREGFK